MQPLCDPTEEGEQGLSNLIDWHEQQVKSNTLFSEIRPLYPPAQEKHVLTNKQFENYDYLNYIVDVSQSEEHLWRNVSKSTRNCIRRSERSGVQVSIVDAPEAVHRTYAMICGKL